MRGPPEALDALVLLSARERAAGKLGRVVRALELVRLDLLLDVARSASPGVGLLDASPPAAAMSLFACFFPTWIGASSLRARLSVSVPLRMQVLAPPRPSW